MRNIRIGYICTRECDSNEACVLVKYHDRYISAENHIPNKGHIEVCLPSCIVQFYLVFMEFGLP